MKEFNYTINGNKYKVAVGDVQGNNVEVTVNVESYTVEMEAKKVEKKRVIVSAPAPAAKPAATAATPGATPSMKDALKAPLPGTIKDVCVTVGDQVAEGQTLVVLEAMKMENKLEAEKAGKVTAVLVNVGDSVMENAPLVVVE